MDVTLLSDDALLGKFDSLVVRDRRNNAALLVYIAEIDARHLYLRRGYESMKAFCMATLDLSEDQALNRVHIARLGRPMPQLFRALAAGRLHMAAIRRLGAILTPQNVDAWISEATNKTASEVEALLAAKFPRTEPLPFDGGNSAQVVVSQEPNAIEHVPGRAQFPVQNTAPRGKLVPISAKTTLLQLSLPEDDQQLLRRARRLVPDASVGVIFHEALKEFVERREKRKFGSERSVRKASHSKSARAIPAHVRKAVYDRDGGRCTYTEPDRKRCGSIDRLEFDHIIPVSRGGQSTVDNLRLLCRAHNRYEAEQVFGKEFMEERRFNAS